MRLILTPEQAAQITPHMRPGFALIGRIAREMFDGTNAGTSGRFVIELGTVAEIALPALRLAIQRAMERSRRAPARPSRRP